MCNEKQDLINFNKKSRNKDGLENWCKSCDKKKKFKYSSQSSEKLKEYFAQKYIEQKKERSEYAKKKYIEKRDERLNKSKEYAQKTKETKSEYDKRYREQNKLKIAQYKKQWATENAQQVFNQQKKYRENNAEKLAIDKSQYAKNNRAKINAKASVYERHRRATDPLYRLIRNTRNMVLRYMFDGKDKKTQEIVGCTFEELKLHIENQFIEGMTWENYGINGWHIDHIKPLAMASTKEEIIASNHYTNLQPMWQLDNLKKGATFDGVNYKTKQK